MAGHVYHWKHGWIRLDHTDAPTAKGLHTRRDVAKAVVGLPKVPGKDRAAPKADIIKAAHKTGSTDLLPKSWQAKSAGREPIHPDTVKDLKGGSADKHLVTDASGTHFNAERTALHDKIVADIVNGHTPRKNPAFVFLGGGPASGKTKAADQAAKDFPDAIKIDPDAIKKMLPEYAKMDPEQAAGFVHEESSYLAKRVTTEALASRAHVVLDAVGNNSATNMRKKVDGARAAGYATHGRYVTVPTEVAQARALSRGIRSGRVVKPTVVGDLHAGVSKVFPDVMHHFDTAALYDNTTEWKQVLTKTKGQPEVIHDLAAWHSFLGKAKG